MNLVDQRCFNHVAREAAARCPQCRRFFCRECIAEHAGRMLCTLCLQQLAASLQQNRARWNLLFLALQFVAALFFLWIFFYTIGIALLKLPAAFHDGALWTQRWWNN